jgi:hypothetical protein
LAGAAPCSTICPTAIGMAPAIGLAAEAIYRFRRRWPRSP